LNLEKTEEIATLKNKIESMTARKTKYQKKSTASDEKARIVTEKLENITEKLLEYEIKAETFPDKYKRKLLKFTKKLDNVTIELAQTQEENNMYKNKVSNYEKKIHERKELRLLQEVIVESPKTKAKKYIKTTPVNVQVQVKSVHTQISLNIKTLVELKDMCKTRGISGYSGKKKIDLITFMLAHKKFI
jgi:chromosome segregation ATPase